MLADCELHFLQYFLQMQWEETQWSFTNNGVLMDIYYMQMVVKNNRNLFQMFCLLKVN